MITKTDLEVYNERLNNILAVIANPPTVTIDVDPSASTTIIDTISNGKLIKIGKGYYTGDIYYKAAEGFTPSGNIQLTKQSGTDVSSYETASVRSASTYTLSITNKSTTNIGVGSVSGGYYPLTASLTGTFSASTTGWFSSGSATDSSVTVGRIAQSSIGSAVANTTDTATVVLDPGKQVTVPAGYYPSARIIRASIADASGEAINAGTATFNADDKATTALTIGTLSNNVYPCTASVSGSVTFSSSGWIEASGRTIQDTAVIVGNIPAGSCSVSGGGLTPGAGAVSGTNVTLSSSNTSGIAVNGAGSVTRAAITKTQTAGYIPAVSSSSVSSQTSVSSNTATRYITDITIEENKTLNSVTNAGTITKITNTCSILDIDNATNSDFYISRNLGIIDFGNNSGAVFIDSNETNGDIYIKQNSGNILINETGSPTHRVLVNNLAVTVSDGSQTVQVTDAAGNIILSGGDRIPDEQIISLVHGIGTF